MPHVVVTPAASLVLRDIVEVGRSGQVPVLRFVRMTGGDTVVLAPPSGARIDGRPMLGGLAVIDRGAGALVRAGEWRVEVRWQSAREWRTAPAGLECAVCFGAIAAGEPIVACRCEAPAHADCATLAITCPGCAAPVQDEAPEVSP
jgi:hypothetical protein